jgi:hypothetical protein
VPPGGKDPDHGSHALTGKGQLLADLTNFGHSLPGSNDPSTGSGHDTTPNGPGIGGAFGNLDHGSKQELKDLLTHYRNDHLI